MMTFWMGSKSCTIGSAPAEIGGFVCLVGSVRPAKCPGDPRLVEPGRNKKYFPGKPGAVQKFGCQPSFWIIT